MNVSFIECVYFNPAKKIIVFLNKHKIIKLIEKKMHIYVGVYYYYIRNDIRKFLNRIVTVAVVIKNDVEPTLVSFFLLNSFL